MRLLVLSLLLATSGCAALRPSAPAASLPAVEWGSSFGMCVGYCSSRLVVAPDGTATLTETGTRSGPIAPRVRSRALTDAERVGLAEAASASTVAADTLGCPDCADGGAEYVEQGGQRVSFEYGGDAGTAAPLAAALRAVRETFPRID